MTQQVKQLLETIQVTHAQEAGRLQVYGLTWANAGGLTYLTLDEALASQVLEITEVNEGGQVPVLKVINRGDVMVFLMAGEQLVGAKQNRVLNADIMVPARGELPIPVSCVESGRWRYRTRGFGSSGTMSHAKLRHLMTKQSTAYYRSEGSPRSDQGEVWEEVDRKLGKMGSSSASHALQQTYEDYSARLDDLLGQVRLPEGCHGVAFAHGGKVAGADLFDRPATLARLWPKVVRGFAIDALEEDAAAAAPAAENVRRWLQTGAQAGAEPFQSPGLGQDVRLEGPEVVGAALVVEEEPVHVELFLNEPAGTAP
jgi:hypothetical protein